MSLYTQSVFTTIDRYAIPSSCCLHMSLHSISTAQHSTAQHSTAQHSTAQHSTAQHETVLNSIEQKSTIQQYTSIQWHNYPIQQVIHQLESISGKLLQIYCSLGPKQLRSAQPGHTLQALQQTAGACVHTLSGFVTCVRWCLSLISSLHSETQCPGWEMSSAMVHKSVTFSTRADTLSKVLTCCVHGNQIGGELAAKMILLIHCFPVTSHTQQSTCANTHSIQQHDALHTVTLQPHRRSALQSPFGQFGHCLHPYCHKACLHFKHLCGLTSTCLMQCSGCLGYKHADSDSRNDPTLQLGSLTNGDGQLTERCAWTREVTRAETPSISRGRLAGGYRWWKCRLGCRVIAEWGVGWGSGWGAGWGHRVLRCTGGCKVRCRVVCRVWVRWTGWGASWGTEPDAGWAEQEPLLASASWCGSATDFVSLLFLF